MEKTIQFINDNSKEAYEKKIYDFLYETAENNLHKKAISYFGINITYKKLLEQIEEYAKGLDALGIKKNDPVMTILPNQPENWELLYSSNYIGAGYAPMLPSIAPKNLEKMMSDLEIKNIFIYRDFYEKYQKQIKLCKVENIIIMDGTEAIPELVKKLISLKEKFKKDDKRIKTLEEYIEILKHRQGPKCKGQKIALYKEFKEAGKERIITKSEYEKNETAAYITTSGTTGIPKLVELTNENFNALALEHLYDVDHEIGDKSLSIMPPSIAYGAGCAHYSLSLGLNSILIPYLVTTPDDLKKLWLKYKPEQFVGGPIHAENIFRTIQNSEGKEREKLLRIYRHAKNIVSGGAPLQKYVEEQLYKKEIIVSQGYGDTETTGGTIYNVPNKYKMYSIGIPFSMNKTKICEPGTNKEVEPNEKGELRGELHVIGPTIMKGYYKNPEATAKAIIINEDGEREHVTGDIVKQIGENLYFEDRITNMFQRMGFNIHPTKINQVIEQNIEVRESVVVKVEHKEEQFVPVAFVSLNANVDIEEFREKLTNILNDTLDELAIPYEIIFTKERLPRNLGGKIDTKKLIEDNNIDYMNEKKLKKTL